LTVFHISAAELRAADGTVVCGECGATFDALGYLSETPPAELPAARPEPQPPPPLADEEAEDMAEPSQARDEEDFLEELESLIGADEQGPDEELVQALEHELGHELGHEPEPEPEPELEPEPEPVFEVEPEPEPEPVFEVEPDQVLAHATGPADMAEARHEAPGAPEHIPEFDVAGEEDWEDLAGGETISGWEPEPGEAGPEYDPDSPFQIDPDSPFRLDANGLEFGEPFGEPFVGTDSMDDENVSMASAAPAADEIESYRGDDAAATSAAPAQAVPTAAPDGDEIGELPEFAARPQRRRRGLVLVVAAATVLVLAGTWAHTQRGTLLRHPAAAAVMGPIYGLIGVEAAPRWSPEKFRALKWEAEADPAQPDRLIVAVEFLNSADFAQPYPVLRVVLEDRFGRRVGSQDVSPAQYLEGYSRGRRLPAGGRVRTTIEVPDPGARAEGFRIDFCLESGSGEPTCGAETFR
jgi:predicted Zn finger-like uncharacterized protein